MGRGERVANTRASITAVWEWAASIDGIFKVVASWRDGLVWIVIRGWVPGTGTSVDIVVDVARVWMVEAFLDVWVRFGSTVTVRQGRTTCGLVEDRVCVGRGGSERGSATPTIPRGISRHGLRAIHLLVSFLLIILRWRCFDIGTLAPNLIVVAGTIISAVGIRDIDRDIRLSIWRAR